MENRSECPDLWQQALTLSEIVHGVTRFRAKEDIRRNWYYRNNLWGGYRVQVTGPVALKFGLWDQAEARHKGDVAKAGLTAREKRAMLTDATFGARFGRGATSGRMSQTDLSVIPGTDLTKMRFIFTPETDGRDG